SAAKVQDALAPLGTISHQLDCAIVFVHHFRKSGGKTVAEATGGAGALGDIARAVYVFGRIPKPDPLARLLGSNPEWLIELEDLYAAHEAEDLRVLACEKLSVAQEPESLLFVL